jgi:tubulin polyglutamylase TTLL1
MKPTAKAQGKGIFLVNKLSQVRAWSNAGAGGQPPGGQLPGGLLSSGAPGGNSNSSAANNAVGSSGNTNSNSSSSTFTSVLRPGQDNYVVSRYISDPLLLGGKKFDLRLYVVVPCYAPLTVYLSDLGFARFCNLKYTSEVAQLDNMYVHLTNVAVQQQGGADFNPAHGNKWALRDLLLYLAAVRGEAATQQLVSDIRVLVVHTLKAVQPVSGCVGLGRGPGGAGGRGRVAAAGQYNR